MSRMRSTALLHNYKWARKIENNPKLIGEADDSIFDITDGHEVLYMIDLIMESKDTCSSSEGQKIEELIHQCCTDSSSQISVKAYIEKNYTYLAQQLT